MPTDPTTPKIGFEIKQGVNLAQRAKINALSAEVVDLEIHFRDRCEVDGQVRAHTFAVFATRALTGIGELTPPEEIPDATTHTIVRVTGLGDDWRIAWWACGRYCLRAVFYRQPSEASGREFEFDFREMLDAR